MNHYGQRCKLEEYIFSWGAALLARKDERNEIKKKS